MSFVGDVVIVDTSVLLNVLNVPGWSTDRVQVYQQFKQFLEGGATLMLPLATVFETGDHIADVKDGRNRRRFARLFCAEVRKALNGEAPWRVVPPPDASQMEKWLECFPDRAMEHISLSDLSQMKLWESLCKKLFGTRVLIWSLDKHLRGYDRKP